MDLGIAGPAREGSAKLDVLYSYAKVSYSAFGSAKAILSMFTVARYVEIADARVW
jgi:hypothetical protein